jgi:hypothetical protein
MALIPGKRYFSAANLWGKGPIPSKTERKRPPETLGNKKKENTIFCGQNGYKTDKLSISCI